MAKTRKKKPVRKEFKKDFLVEVAWEVCNQVGGIYTVIRSKVPAVEKVFGDDYLLVGPALHPDRFAEIDELSGTDDMVEHAVIKLRKKGYDVFYGVWLVTGRPRVVLFNIDKELANKKENSRELSVKFGIKENLDDFLLQQVIAFGKMTQLFFELLSVENKTEPYTIIGHFHEWMASIPVLSIKLKKLPIKTVFTTHATILGRFLAMNDTNFYSNLTKYKWKDEAKRFGIEPLVDIERLSAHSANAFTTVSEITALECKYFLNRYPDHILPNGLNIKRFVALHEVQILHQTFKEKINQFVMGHFFNSSPFDLDKTLYFFTSGRYEYHNKGYDLTLEALKRLNKLMIRDKVDMTVVMFIVTKRPSWSINPEVLESRGIMEEIRQNTRAIQKQIGHRLFMAAAGADDDYRLPDLNKLVDDYWKLRYRRTIQAWKSDKWPIIVTHNLQDQDGDEILTFLRKNKLINNPVDKVKVVYHPDFISSAKPLFGIDYGDFVRGCHLGVFPSYYEPWGYTPLECIASGVPAITSDLSGFGDYIKSHLQVGFDKGIEVLHRDGKHFNKAADELARVMLTFVKKNRRFRIAQRGRAEDLSEEFDWNILLKEYIEAYRIAISQ